MLFNNMSVGQFQFGIFICVKYNFCDFGYALTLSVIVVAIMT